MRPLDLTTPIPEFQAQRTQIPDAVRPFYNGPWIFNGAFQFADSSHRGQWDAGSGTWSPRIGAAYRINDKTSVRAAYGRYVTPWISGTTDFNNLTTPGYTKYTGAPAWSGRAADAPFESLPIQLSGDSGLSEDSRRLHAARRQHHLLSNESPAAEQRSVQLFGPAAIADGMVVDLTYYLNRSGFVFDTTRNLNLVDPNIIYK